MKVKTIYVKNLRQIDEVNADFKGCTAIVTGGNNKGKSTLLRSIVDRLRGNKCDIVKQGETEGKAEWSFTDGSTLSREISGDKEKIIYVTKEGFKVDGIKSICTKLFGKGFDIDTFLQSTPKDQKQTMQELVGLNFTDIEKEYAEAYQERALLKKQLESEKAKAFDMEVVKVDGEYQDISKMQDELIEIEKKNEQIVSIESRLKDKQDRKLQIEQQIKDLQEELKVVDDDIKKGNDWLSSNKKQDVSVVRDNIAKQKNINDLVEHNKKVEDVAIIIKDAELQVENAEIKVKSIETKKMEMIKSANMPKGFEFSDDGLLFNGYPLDRSHLSSSQTYIAGLMLASMNMGEVQTLTFDASYLDKNSLEEIEMRASTKGLQLLIERPDFDGGDIKYEIIE